MPKALELLKEFWISRLGLLLMSIQAFLVGSRVIEDMTPKFGYPCLALFEKTHL